MANKPAVERKIVKVREVRVPWKKLFDGKPIRDGMAALDEWRRQFNEDEILYKRTVKIKWNSWGEIYAVVERPETDAEYKKRRDAAEAARLTREKNKLEKAKKAAEAEEAKVKLLDKFKSMTFEEYMKKVGVSERDLLNEMNLDLEDLKKLDKLK